MGYRDVLSEFSPFDPGKLEPQQAGLYDVLWYFNGRDAIYLGTAERSKGKGSGHWLAKETPGGAMIGAFRVQQSAKK